jgi:hypothetical protein
MHIASSAASGAAKLLAAQEAMQTHLRRFAARLRHAYLRLRTGVRRRARGHADGGGGVLLIILHAKAK